ncbi:MULTISPECIES: hypothetical protein [unclassified Flavobacterium]|uniref:hypothetical protein n=1 Tax=unclassified Flavobacterium TaxID=196869 RepID=UPI00095A43F9|nr:MULTISPECIES: hypothetical protein [unclassified Flavobacterium]MBN9284454.1 hypothetical protein [Flavobacterium sp.]OJV72752.1 MAG: hypothetical protein BGO42_15100 [Flavobacterium sp. 40-81]
MFPEKDGKQVVYRSAGMVYGYISFPKKRANNKANLFFHKQSLISGLVRNVIIDIAGNNHQQRHNRFLVHFLEKCQLGLTDFWPVTKTTLEV